MDVRISIFITYILATFIMAAGWHLFLFKPVYERLKVFTRKKPIISLGFISMFLQALVVAYFYPIFAGSINSIGNGLVFGILFIGVFMGSNAVLAEAGKNEVGPISTWIILEGTYYLLQGAVIGLLLGIIY